MTKQTNIPSLLISAAMLLVVYFLIAKWEKQAEKERKGNDGFPKAWMIFFLIGFCSCVSQRPVPAVFIQAQLTDIKSLGHGVNNLILVNRCGDTIHYQHSNIQQGFLPLIKGQVYTISIDTNHSKIIDGHMFYRSSITRSK